MSSMHNNIPSILRQITAKASTTITATMYYINDIQSWDCPLREYEMPSITWQRFVRPSCVREIRSSSVMYSRMLSHTDTHHYAYTNTSLWLWESLNCQLLLYGKMVYATWSRTHAMCSSCNWNGWTKIWDEMIARNNLYHQKTLRVLLLS